MRRKKTFVLLEIIIGFSLVTLSILPFLRYPFRYMHAELGMLFEVQLTRVAQERLCALERQMYEGQVDESFLFGEKAKKAVYSTVPTSIKLADGWQRQYTEEVRFVRSAKRKDDEYVYSLVSIQLSYKAKGSSTMEFRSKIIAQKKI